MRCIMTVVYSGKIIVLPSSLFERSVPLRADGLGHEAAENGAIIILG